MLPQRGLTALVLFFHCDSVSAFDAPHCLFAHVMQFLKGDGANQAFLPPWMKVNPSVGILCLVVPLLPQTLTMCAAFASSMYLLPQRGGKNRLFCPRRWIHVCKYGISAHVMQFLKGHGGRLWVFAYVVGFTCVDPAFLPLSSFIDIVLNCGPNCGKSPLNSGRFAIRRGLCRCSARRIAR